MGSEWQSAYLTELYDVSSGLSKPANFFGSGFPFVAFKDVMYNYFLPNELSQLVQSTADERRKCSVKRGDVFLCRTSETMNELGMSSVAVRDYENATFNGFTKRLRPKKDTKLVPEFVAYYLRSPKFRSEMNAFSTMSTRASLNNEMIGRLVISFPSVDEQTAIGYVLKSLDDKIELNRRMNETLESMARALFKSWFVDFDPVIDNALAAGNAIPEPLATRAAIRRALGTKRKRLPENIQKLFPATFTFNEEMGWIPEGWEVDSIRNRSSNVQYGFTQSSSNDCVGPRFLRITDIRGGHVSWQSVPFCVASADEIDKYRIVDGDVLVARTGASTGENTYIVSPPQAVFASYLVRFQFASQGVSRYVGQFMRTPAFFNYVTGSIGGSAQPNASAQTLGAARCVFPSVETGNVFYEQLRSADLKRVRNEEVSDSLTKLRDTLLPKLLSGELRIPDAEKLVAGSV